MVHTIDIPTLNVACPANRNIIQKFKKVILSVSVDGYGKDVEYSRHGFKWDTFVKNLEKVRGRVSRKLHFRKNLENANFATFFQVFF